MTGKKANKSTGAGGNSGTFHFNSLVGAKAQVGAVQTMSKTACKRFMQPTGIYMHVWSTWKASLFHLLHEEVVNPHCGNACVEDITNVLPYILAGTFSLDAEYMTHPARKML